MDASIYKQRSVFHLCYTSSHILTIVYMLLFVIQGILPSSLVMQEANFINEIIGHVFEEHAANMIFMNGLIILGVIAIK